MVPTLQITPVFLGIFRPWIFNTSWCSIEKKNRPRSQLASNPMDFPSVSSTSILYWFPMVCFEKLPPFQAHRSITTSWHYIPSNISVLLYIPIRTVGSIPISGKTRMKIDKPSGCQPINTPTKNIKSPMESLVQKPHHCVKKHGHRRQLTPQFRPVDGMQSLWSPWTECHWMPSLTWKYVFFTKGVIPIHILFFSPIKISGWSHLGDEPSFRCDITTSRRHKRHYFLFNQTMFILLPILLVIVVIKCLIKGYTPLVIHGQIKHVYYTML